MKTHDLSDVSCRSIMDASPAVLAPETTFAEAVGILREKRLLAMPVVDAQGCYLGMFRKNLVISNVLPQVALNNDRCSQTTRLIEAGLLRDTLCEVRARFAAIAREPVSRFADAEAPVLRPDQSLVTALFYLYRGRNFLPVVDPVSRRLLGVISTWDVLETMGDAS